MNKIISEQKLNLVLQKIKKRNKTIVLVGGVFDILHPGHISFLQESKKFGDYLFVLLESDENVRKNKGSNRPINDQQTRAKILSSLHFVDHIILLTGVTKSSKYDKLIVQIQPDVIALTTGDPQTDKRLYQCKLVGARLEQVDKVVTASTTELIKQNG